MAILRSNSVINIILKFYRHYNLAVNLVCFIDLPEYTANTDTLGSLRILEQLKM